MKLRFPHPLTLLLGFIALVAVLSWVLPAGQFERRDDPVTGRSLDWGDDSLREKNANGE